VHFLRRLARKKYFIGIRVSMLLKSRVWPDMLPFSLCNKKKLAIWRMNRPLFPATLSVPSYEIGKYVWLRTYQLSLLLVVEIVARCFKRNSCVLFNFTIAYLISWRFLTERYTGASLKIHFTVCWNKNSPTEIIINVLTRVTMVLEG
jgi:hypothetical protein